MYTTDIWELESLSAALKVQLKWVASILEEHLNTRK